MLYAFGLICYDKIETLYMDYKRKRGGCMTGKEIVNLIRSLRADGVDDTKILNLIEYIETHDPQENESYEKDNSSMK